MGSVREARPRPRLPALIAAVLVATAACAAAAALLHATVWGVGVSPDSVRYLDAARHLAAGQGLSTGLDGAVAPLTHYPPLYPLLLAPLAALETPEPESVRWLNALLLVATVCLVGGAAYRGSRGSPGAAALGAGLVAAHPGVFRAHAHAWSEPPFFLLVLASLLLVSSHARRPDRRRLVLAGILAGVSVLARYAGVAVVAAGVLATLFARGRRAAVERVRDGLGFLAAAAVPILPWALRTALVRGSPVDRDPIVAPISGGTLRQGAATLAGWLLPGDLPGDLPASAAVPVAAALAVLLLAGSVVVLRRRRAEEPPLDLTAFLLFLVAYPLALLASLALFDPFIPLDHRILAPAFPPAAVLVVCAASAVLRRAGRWPLAVAALAAVGLLALYAVDVASWAGRAHRRGLAFTAKVWRQSPTLAALEGLDPGRLVFTNGHDVVYFHTGRALRPLPVAWQPPERFRAEVEEVGRRLDREGGRIVWFERLRWRDFYPTPDQLEAVLPLEVVERFSDGVMLRPGTAGEGGELPGARRDRARPPRRPEP